MKTIVPTLFLLSLFPNAATALFRCLFQPTRRCGLMNVGVTVRIGGAGEDCAEKCILFFVTAPFKCGICAAAEDDYDIELSFGSSVPASDQGFFTAAATRWESIVTKGLTSSVTDALDVTEGCDYPITIDDLFICVTYITFDGVNGTVGGTRLKYSQRFGNFLPIVAEIQLDEADISSLKERGIFDDIVLRSVGRGVGKIFPT
jgi:hypothetical protein